MLVDNIIKRQQNKNFRSLRFVKDLIDFSSNDYLGLANSETFKQRIILEWQKIKGVGSTGSRLLTGHNFYISHLEKEIASFHGFETGLIFNCGYMANLGLASALGSEKAIFLYDTHIHASTLEGIRVSKTQAFPFKHNDTNHLEKRLKAHCSKNKNLYVFVESIYSTDGSLAPLEELFYLSKNYQAHLIVDEAHAVGLYGKNGQGRVFEAGLSGQVFAQIITFGKALGVFGAIVLGNHILKDTLINFARPFIYTTALPFYCLAAIQCSYKTFPKMGKERRHIQQLINKAQFSKTPIQPVPIKNKANIEGLIKKINIEGFDIRALLSPTVQKGKEIFRLTLHAFNKKQDLTNLLTLIKTYE